MGVSAAASGEIKRTLELRVKRGLPCAEHAALGRGCASNCRRCLSAVDAEADGLRAKLRRWQAGYRDKPILESVVITVE